MSLLGSKRAQNTAYHPHANQMAWLSDSTVTVSAFKAQLMPGCTVYLSSSRHLDRPPRISTAADMVNGTTHRLPGEFPPTNSLPDPSDFVTKLKAHIQTSYYTSFTPSHSKDSNPDDLSTATHVFVWCDAVRKPLITTTPFKWSNKPTNILLSLYMVATILSRSISSSPPIF